MLVACTTRLWWWWQQLRINLRLVTTIYVLQDIFSVFSSPPLSPLPAVRKKTVTYRKKTVTYRKKTVTSGTDVPRPPEWPWKAKGDEVLQTIANLNQESSLQARIAGSFYPDQELLS